jgi:hypothetical protein
MLGDSSPVDSLGADRIWPECGEFAKIVHFLHYIHLMFINESGKERLEPGPEPEAQSMHAAKSRNGLLRKVAKHEK